MIKIISDSTCDLSKDLIEKYDITILPLHIHLDEEEYQDGLTGYFEANGAGEFESEEEFEAYYTREILYESILWDKTFQVMVENATPIENS